MPPALVRLRSMCVRQLPVARSGSKGGVLRSGGGGRPGMAAKRLLQADAVERKHAGAPHEGTMHGDELRCFLGNQMNQ